MMEASPGVLAEVVVSCPPLSSVITRLLAIYDTPELNPY
jgi:hypothetical protein